MYEIYNLTDTVITFTVPYDDGDKLITIQPNEVGLVEKITDAMKIAKDNGQIDIIEKRFSNTRMVPY
ncbi:MAG: hypothetical protein ACP5JE_05975 [Thermoplasmata archaeon]